MNQPRPFVGLPIDCVPVIPLAETIAAFIAARTIPEPTCRMTVDAATSPRPIVPNPSRPAPTQPRPGTPSPMDPTQRPPSRPRVVDAVRAWARVAIALAEFTVSLARRQTL